MNLSNLQLRKCLSIAGIYKRNKENVLFLDNSVNKATEVRFITGDASVTIQLFISPLAQVDPDSMSNSFHSVKLKYCTKASIQCEVYHLTGEKSEIVKKRHCQEN